MEKFKKYQSSLGVHDPTIIFHEPNQTYYMYATDTSINGEMKPGILIRKSMDLMHWENLHNALSGIPKWVYEYTNPGNLWAPEVVLINGVYRMYYSASMFGTNQSVIGLAEATHPEGPWIDQGLVLSSHPDKSEANAIDANVLYDRDHQLWFVYGSFFSGIHIKKLDEKSGKLLNPNTEGTCIARRSINVEGAIEGPFIYYHKNFDMYYLFTSYDFLGESYNVRVARSKDIEGPYVDTNGYGMFGEIDDPHRNGTKILGSYNLEPEPHWTSIGHNSILDVHNTQYMVAHSRVKHQHYPHFLYLKPLIWLDSGWPVVSLGEFIEFVETKPNNFKGIVFDENSTESMVETDLNIDTTDYKTYRCTLENGDTVIAICGINAKGQAYWGYRREDIA